MKLLALQTLPCRESRIIYVWCLPHVMQCVSSTECSNTYNSLTPSVPSLEVLLVYLPFPLHFTALQRNPLSDKRPSYVRPFGNTLVQPSKRSADPILAVPCREGTVCGRSHCRNILRCADPQPFHPYSLFLFNPSFRGCRGSILSMYGRVA